MKEKKSKLQNKKNERIGEGYLPEHNKQRKLYRISGIVAVLVVVMVTAYMLMLPGITLEREPLCGLEEHVHDDDCYIIVGYDDEADEDEADEDEADEDEFGEDETGDFDDDFDDDVDDDVDEELDEEPDEEPSEERVLVCEMEEHTHTRECYYPNGEDETEEMPTEESLNDEELEEESDEKSGKNVSSDDEDVTEAAEESDDEESGEDATEAELNEERSANEEGSTEETSQAGVFSLKARSSYQLILGEEEDSITSEELYYKCSEDNITTWTLVTDDVVLHGTDSMQLNIGYNVYISDVIDSNYTMYYPLPDWMKVDESFKQEKRDESNNLIAVITSSDGYIVVTFDQDWIDSQPGTASTLKGSMSMEASFSINHVTGGTLTIGDLVINVDYQEGEWLAKYETVNIAKSKATYIEEDDGRDILQYTLTVTTGEAGMPDIKVEDAFSDTTKTLHIADMIEEIVDVTVDETEISNTDGLIETSTAASYAPGKISYANETLVWNIGDMQAYETRTLTYQVRLKSQYTGLYHKNALVFYNVAKVYSKSYEREMATNQLDLYGQVDPYKYQVSYEPGSDGLSGTITYAIYLKNDAKTNYTVHNMKVFDFFTNPSTTYVDMYLDEDSFYLYPGDATTAAKKAYFDNAGNRTKVTPAAVTKNDKGQFSDFTCYVGDFAPGVSKTLVYSIKVGESFYLNNNGYFTATNRVTTYEDDTKNTAVPNRTSSAQKGGYIVNSKISFGSWVEKFTPTRVESSEEITMDGTVYDSDNNISTETSFSVARGDYKYRVILNQDGKTDIHALDLTDTLSTYLQYAGYMRIDEYDTLSSVTLRNANRVQVDPGELAEPILSTTWVKIDGKKSLSFHLSDFNLSGKNAYVLTYYTKLVNTGESLYVSVNNDFEAQGTVYGSGGTGYTLAKMYMKITSQATVTSSCELYKDTWYYDYPRVSDTDPWNHGSLYWLIKAVGTEIPANTAIKDLVEDTYYHKLVEPDSFLGVYITDSSLSPATFEELQSASEEVESDRYTLKWNTDENSFEVEFLEDIVIPDDHVIYVIVKTAVLNYPTSGRAFTYQNSLYKKSSGGTSFQKTGDSAQKTISGSPTTTKKLADNVTVYDGKTFWQANNLSATQLNGTWGNYMDSNKKYSLITEPGTYIEYQIRTGLDGRLTGDITLSDTLAEGLELVFLRNQWFSGCTPVPSADNVEIEELEEEIKNNPRTHWTRYQQGNKKNSNATSPYCIYYYNSETRELRWKIANAKATSGGFFDFQLVLKVVDEEVLLGEKTGVYKNSVSVTKDDDKFVEKVNAADVTLTRKSMSKEVDGSATGNIIPFKIVVNEMGENLLENSEYITLVDELGVGLTLDISSIKITDKNGTALTKDEYTAALEKADGKTYLRLTIPDDKKLTITYKVSVNGAQGDTVSISNVAHWEGYEALPDTDVEISEFTINFDVELSGHASLRLTKRDAEDIMTTLPGAEFTMQEAILNDDGTYTLTGEVYSGTTDENGEIYFSSDVSWMKFDTIYCITETKAPDGYVLDENPHYIVLATKSNKKSYPSEVEVQRGTIQFAYEATNDKIAYEMPETGGEGTYPIQTAGGVFLALGCAMYVKKRRRKTE